MVIFFFIRSVIGIWYFHIRCTRNLKWHGLNIGENHSVVANARHFISNIECIFRNVKFAFSYIKRIRWTKLVREGEVKQSITLFGYSENYYLDGLLYAYKWHTYPIVSTKRIYLNLIHASQFNSYGSQLNMYEVVGQKGG